MAKFSRAIDRIPLSEADKIIKTYRRVEENGEVRFEEVKN
jgi:hypothetical protein